MSTFYTFAPKTKEDFKLLSQRINYELSLIQEWLQLNKLSLNVEKKQNLCYSIVHKESLKVIMT